MSKLAKGLALAGGGVPAAAILSICVLNANTEEPHTHLAANTLVPTPEAMVQPNSLASSGPLSTRTRAEKAAHRKHRASRTPARPRIGAQVVAYARTQLGIPYVFGGASPQTGFDCSGLVLAAYRSAGITLPRTSDAQYWWGKRIAPGAERPGDLVFFDYRRGHSGPGHVGVVTDPAKGLMIVAPHTGSVVKYQNYRTYPGGPVGFTRPAAGRHELP
jgi:cell wall-associated NlpC family hydrolase